MLAYHPMDDANHCALRILSILHDATVSQLSMDALRILDFYVLFPERLETFRFPKSVKGARKIVSAIPKPYEIQISNQLIFAKLSKIQEQTVRSLVARGILSRMGYLEDKAELDKKTLSADITSILSNQGFRDSDWYQLIIDPLAKLPVFGADGLKSRSGLMEFRHDRAEA